MQLFYQPDIRDNLLLDITESQHCIKALRHKTGDLIRLIDGKGKLYEGTISNDNPKGCEVDDVKEVRSDPRPDYPHLVISPTKNPDRMEWFVEKATEIGVSQITFISSRYSERSNVNLKRMEKKAISALKQSQGLWLPTLNPLVPLLTFLNSEIPSQKFIAHSSNPPRHLSNYLKNQVNDATLLIGPEGGFSDEEIDQAIERGFLPVSLGQNVLRTETAGVVACALLSVR